MHHRHRMNYYCFQMSYYSNYSVSAVEHLVLRTNSVDLGSIEDKEYERYRLNYSLSATPRYYKWGMKILVRFGFLR